MKHFLSSVYQADKTLKNVNVFPDGDGDRVRTFVIDETTKRVQEVPSTCVSCRKGQILLFLKGGTGNVQPMPKF